MQRRRGFFLAVAIGVLTACQSIVGIEDRRYAPAIEGSPACEAYCTTVLSACTGSAAAYPDRDTCIVTCGELPSGEVKNDNSLECRSEQAEFAESSAEPEVHCPGAGPFGAGTCGSACASYCTLLVAACPETLAGVGDCVTLCGGLRADKQYDLSQLGSGDNVECRIAHASAALLSPTTECPAAALKSSVCIDPKDGAPSCQDYCKLVMTACTGESAVYESEKQCLAVCALLDQGTNGDTTTDTVGCRKYHSYNSLAAPTQHCPHAGPGGDGHCGADNCEGYCNLLEAACAVDFQSTFGDQTSCRSQCAALPGAGADEYAGAAKTGNTVRCRLVNLARAAEDPATYCAASVGGGECQ